VNAPDLEFKPTTGALIRRAAELFGDRDFVVTDNGRWSYREIDRAAQRLAKRLLAAGVGKGARIAAQYPNGPDWVVAWLAVTRIGALFMPLSTGYKPPELARCLRIGDAQLFLSPADAFGSDRAAFIRSALPELGETPADRPIWIGSHPFLREVWLSGAGASGRLGRAVDLEADAPADGLISDGFLEEIESEVFPSDLMFAIFTSGTSSDPKCVIHIHGAPIRHAAALGDLLQSAPADRIYAGMPFYWVGGSCYTLLPTMLHGGAVLCVEKFDPERVLDLMEAERATRLTGWAGVVGPLMSHPTRARRRIPAFDNPDWAPTSTGLRPTGLGMSETCANHTGLRIDDRELPAAQGSVGRPLPHLEHRIVDPISLQDVEDGQEGVILVRGYSMLDSLYKAERASTFSPDGFYNTQDRGRMADGFLHFVGRNSDMIKTSGNNVAPAEVDAALRGLPGVSNSFVLGLPDAERGQTVAAVLVPQPGVVLEPEKIREQLFQVLSNYKVPRQIKVLAESEFPWLPTGKPDARAIRAMFEAAGAGANGPPPAL
jgi:acyl-CoA synthetase (AMP-forming)/AMP-acid ligase II